MVRKFALAALALLSAPIALHAQVGIKGGISWANVSNSGVLPGSLDSRTGFAAGLSLNTKPDVVGIGVEGMYAQRGIIGQDQADTRRLDYIDIPAYLRLMIPASGVAPFAYAGPQISFELSCRDGAGNDCPNTGRPSTTYAAVVGAGLLFGDRKGGFSIEGRYAYGLTDLKLSTVTTSESYHSRSFMILAGIGF